MAELYWITRLDVLLVFLIVTLFLLSAVFLACAIEIAVMDSVTAKKICKRLIFPIVVSVIGVLFIPSKEDMLLIYGLGNTIEYLQTNDKAKQLPDKCVDALVKWIESMEKYNEKID